MPPNSTNYLNFTNKGSGFTGFLYTAPWNMKVNEKKQDWNRDLQIHTCSEPPGPTRAEQRTKSYSELHECKKETSHQTQELTCVTVLLLEWFPRHQQHINSVPVQERTSMSTVLTGFLSYNHRRSKPHSCYTHPWRMWQKKSQQEQLRALNKKTGWRQLCVGPETPNAIEELPVFSLLPMTSFKRSK